MLEYSDPLPAPCPPQHGREADSLASLSTPLDPEALLDQVQERLDQFRRSLPGPGDAPVFDVLDALDDQVAACRYLPYVPLLDRDDLERAREGVAAAARRLTRVTSRLTPVVSPVVPDDEPPRGYREDVPVHALTAQELVALVHDLAAALGKAWGFWAVFPPQTGRSLRRAVEQLGQWEEEKRALVRDLVRAYREGKAEELHALLDDLADDPSW